MFITATFQWTAGFSFSAGMVDFIFSYSMPLAHQPWMLIIEGIFVFVLYYYIFSFCIRKFNLHTPGREFELNDTIQISFSPQEMDEIAKKIIDACGGQDNIIKIHTCITRLHIELKILNFLNLGILNKLEPLPITKSIMKYRLFMVDMLILLWIS